LWTLCERSLLRIITRVERPRAYSEFSRSMQLPKIVAASLCTAILGAQLWASFPISRTTNGWYWPFMSYPMYAIAHERGDSLVVPELRVTKCTTPAVTTIADFDSLGAPPAQLNALLTTIARGSGTPSEQRLRERLTRLVDAQFPGRYCKAAVWTRTVFVADTSTHHLRAPMRRAAEWAMNSIGGE